ncbi:carbohydrate-binding module family 1 protein [Periconia macrospinosa]|uniref:Carbohydrate-binding module family 1 protein n=1 Tax=Periconia macrospinosa TaxID=97972 RepID=A0A2V1DFP3_9PLEO|nr:carbohydrate-binding module family 1 protein [Periconia macrospinosa]
MKSYTAINLAALVSTVAAHGYITSPTPRKPGDAMAAACGQQIFQTFSSDINGNMQGALQNPGPNYDAAKCNIWTCKGMQFEDNKANVQSYTAGQTVPMVINIAAPHTGTANVSVIDLATSSPIGQALKSWDVYASTARGVQPDEKNFDITIPTDLGSKCATAGACALQWWWDSREVDQSYAGCIDFTVGGSGSGDAPAPAPSSSAAAPATSAAAPAPSSAAPSSAAPAPSSAPSSSAVAAPSSAPSSAAAAQPTTLATSARPAPTSGSGSGAAVSKWGQCGGKEYKGATSCADGWVCKDWNPYYSQCISA